MSAPRFTPESSKQPDGAFDFDEDLEIGRAHEARNADVLDEDEDREHGVAHRPNRLPNREEEEEELSEADIMEELDLDQDGPDA
jgi:hypothetical protein